MSTANQWYSENISQIDRVDFGIFTNKKVKKYSAVKSDPFGINLHESYDNYEPKKGGLVDLRLGTSDYYLACTTCGLSVNECPGHFGHTVLAEPVFHFGFLDHLKSLMQCICIKCSNILIEKKDNVVNELSKYKRDKRYKRIREMTKKTTYCYYCGAPVPRIKKEVREASASIRIALEREVGANIVDEKTGIVTETKKKIKEYISPRECYNICRNISNDDAKILGFNPDVSRPEDLIISNFPIPPVAIRPTAKIDFLASSTMEDSLTLKIADIIKCNIRIRKLKDKQNIGSDLSSYSQDSHTLLQYHVATFYDNDKVSLPKSEFKTGGKPTKSISDRLKSKAGRVRANLMGKRVDFSARSVITSDPYIDIDQVGVPLKEAKNLTVPVEVTPNNIDYLTKLVKNGRDIYPGANRLHLIRFVNGKLINQKIDLRYRKQSLKLNYGDIVERHIINGDRVLFNRQPTLHKPSMMGHRVHVLNRDDIHTFRMNVSVTKPYNADFDGDEMNFFLPQSIQASNELKYIANARLQIIGAGNSNPIIGCVQDPVSGSFLLSLKDVKLTGEEALTMLAYTTSDTLSEIDKNKMYNGKEVFSHIIPKGINSIKKKNDNIYFQIKNGNLITGKLDKSSLSTKKNSIIHYVWDKYGPDKTQKFIDDSQRLILNYLMLRGYSIGFQDAVLPLVDRNKIENLINSKILEYKFKITEMENESIKFDPSLFESTLTGDLSAITSNVEKIMKNSLDLKNNLFVAIDSGAKGSFFNLQQIMGCLGQQLLEGTRIKKKISGRTLPHYHYQDDTPEARGFIKNSYLSGLTGCDYFWQAAAGREGLIDTAIKTATTGYLQRRLIKALEDIHVCYDGSVRTAQNLMLQMLYGDSGINQAVQTEIKLEVVGMNNKQVEDKFTFSKTELKKFKGVKNIKELNKNLLKNMIKYRDKLRKNQIKFSMNYKIMDDKFMLPINFVRIIQENLRDSNKKNKLLDPSYIIERLEKFLSHDITQLISVSESSSMKDNLIDDENRFKLLLRIALYEYLNPKRCIFEYNFTTEDFDTVMKEMILSFNKAVVDPGEMVGIISAQSIGEPTSQLTLDTKHFAGKMSSANMGVGRIQELINYSKSIKTPMMTIYFDDEISSNTEIVNNIKTNFKFVSIRELINSAEIIYFLNDSSSYGKLINDDNVKNPFFTNNNKVSMNSLNWIFRLELNREQMLMKNITMLDIKTKFIVYWYENFSTLKNLKKIHKDIFSKIIYCAISSNFDTSPVPVIHVRFNMTSFNYLLLTEFLKVVLDEITLKGIPSITGVEMDEERKISFDKNTGDIVLKREHVLTTSGINIHEIKFMKGINHSRTHFNDIHLTYKLYGIEAARYTICKQLSKTYEANGAYLNFTHLSILVDLMTHTGGITSIDRHGIGKLDIDPLAKASFEKTMDHFIVSGLFNKKDYMNSVSSRIMVGRVIPGGTGFFDILLDTSLLERTEYGDNETGGRITFNPLEEMSLFEDILSYGFNNIDFFIPN